MARLKILLGVMLLLASNVGANPKKSGKDWYEASLRSAPTVVAYERRIKNHMAWSVDAVETDYVELAVGEDFPDHFTRGLTVRVHRDGAVYVLEENEAGDETWRLDRAPDRKRK